MPALMKTARDRVCVGINVRDETDRLWRRTPFGRPTVYFPPYYYAYKSGGTMVFRQFVENGRETKSRRNHRWTLRRFIHRIDAGAFCGNRGILESLHFNGLLGEACRRTK